jgi:hypothetical protein
MRGKALALGLCCTLVAGAAAAQVAADFGGTNGGSVRAGYDSTTCTSANAGAIRYSSATNTPSYCNGSAWTPFGDATCPAFGLVARWTMEEGSGTTIADSIGGGGTGTLTNGPTWTTGRSGNGINFDGTNDYVNVPVNSTLNTTSNTTISAWFKADVTTGTRRIVALPASESGGTEKYALYITANTLRGAVRVNGSDVNLSTAFTDTASWHNAVLVFSDDYDSVSLYLDGVLKTFSASVSGSIASNTNGNFQIGRYGPTYGQYFDGVIDDVRVYTSALASDEVAALYTSTCY